ncbi:MAG: hypothetical protein ACLP9L_02495 [Thermoguttaceae bacterium]
MAIAPLLDGPGAQQLAQPLLEGARPSIGTVWASVLKVVVTVAVAAVLLRWCERRLVIFL